MPVESENGTNGGPESESLEARRTFFLDRQGDRYWWHRHIKHRYVPDVYRVLSNEEWAVLTQWYEATDLASMHGECGVPPMGWLSSFVTSNDVSRIVQLGTYAGYSALLLGWALRRCQKRHGLVAVDIDPVCMDFARKWVDRAGLSDTVQLLVASSDDASLPLRAEDYLGGSPELVFIDSSHQYAHTLRELRLWYEALAPGGLLVLHDTSTYSARFDSTGQGGVVRAFEEWRHGSRAEALSIFTPDPYPEGFKTIYLDSYAGLGVIYKTT